MTSPRRHATMLMVALALAALPATAVAMPQPTEDASGSGERAVVLPSFTESPSCGGPYGIAGPYASHPGAHSDDEPILGPWGDFFGRSVGDVRSRLVEMQLPGGIPVWVHERVAPALQQVIDNLAAEAAAGRVYQIRSWDTWSFNPVTVPPGRRFSFHAVGAAIDINSTSNPYRSDNVLITDMPAWFVRAWTDAGWCWGGDWSSIKDPMHFSWRGPLYTTDYAAPSPTPPLTQPSDYDTVITVPTGLGPIPPATEHVIGDVDRDGAPDIVRLRAWTAGGHLVLEAAIANHDHETCQISEMTTRVPTAPAGYAFVDYTGDARADLWAFDDTSGTLNIEIYDWAEGYATGPVITSAVAGSPGTTYMAGDHDRDGTTDLYVVRPGESATLEIWAGPGFTTRLVERDLDVAVSGDHRLALGDADADGIPDLYVVAPGEAASLWIAHGASGFEVAAAGPTGIAAHHGRTMHITDYDGDGRDDLVFLDADGTASIYLGGTGGPEREPASWFSASWATTWPYREGCLLSPGFETEDGFGDTRFADAAGPGAAFAYPNPMTGTWTVADLGWAWWKQMDGRLVDLEPVNGPAGPGYGALLTQGSTSVQVMTVDGNSSLRISIAGRNDPLDLAVLEHDGAPALAVAFGSPSPQVIVRDLSGNRLATVSLRRLDTAALLSVGDVTGDGNDDLLAVGLLPSGRLGTRVISVDGGVVAAQSLPVRRDVAAAALIPATGGTAPRVAVLLPHPDDRAARILLVDAATGSKGRSMWTDPARTGTIASSWNGSAPVLIVALRHAVTGAVLVEGRDVNTGSRLWQSAGSIGFDPADADVLPSGAVLITGHRYGDGNVEVSWWDPGSGARTG
jgi:hypothetical protein